MKVDKYDTAGKRLRYFREEETGESREKFSEGLDITPRTLERYENDESSPDASFLAKLNAKYQGMLNLDWLLTGRGSLYINKTNHEPGKTREEEQEYYDVMLEKMHQQLDRVYRQRDFLKLSALQSLLNLIDREKEKDKS
jgi:transcriptional regulator with XRE-family HTH domain